MISMNKTRFIVNIDDLQTLYPNRYKKLLMVYREQTIFSKALADVVNYIDLNYYQLNKYKFRVGFTGLTLMLRSPREITSPLLGRLVCVFGICIKIGSISVSLERSVQYCPANNTFVYNNYTPSSTYIPTRDFDGNSLVRLK
jgi:DNA replicative helicase MCM subunit Mcm2 (Cdc46/Mcm family)